MTNEALTNKITYCIMNHEYAGNTKDGYAVCENCGYHENEETRPSGPCINGPAVEETRRILMSKIRDENLFKVLNLIERVKNITDLSMETDPDSSGLIEFTESEIEYILKHLNGWWKTSLRD